MAEKDQIISDLATTPLSVRRKDPKKVVKKHETPQAVAKSKAIAVSMLENALADERTGRKKISEKLTKAEITPRAIYEAFKNFEDEVGGRKALMTLLLNCPENSMAYNMVRQLTADPDFLRGAEGDAATSVYALDVLCARHKLPFNSIVQAFRDSKTAKMAIESLMQVSSRVPELIEQVIEDSSNTWRVCTRCEGLKRVPVISQGEYVIDEDSGDVATRLCGQCDGRGKIFTKHDFQNRKALLDLAGLTKKEALINQTFNNKADVYFEFGPDSGNYESIMRAVDKVISPTANHLTDDAVIDVEVVDVP